MHDACITTRPGEPIVSFTTCCLFSLQAGVLTLLVSSLWFELVRHLESQKLQLPHEKPQKHGNTKLSSAKRLFCCIFQGITDRFVLSIHGLNSILSMESQVCFHSMEWHPWNGTIPWIAHTLRTSIPWSGIFHGIFGCSIEWNHSI